VKNPAIKNHLIRVGLMYGAIGGAVVIVLILGLHFMGRNPLIDIRIVDVVILAVFLVFSMREFRDRFNNGALHYWQGVSVGMVTYFVTALISAAFILVFVEFVKPDILQGYVTNRLELLDMNKQQLIDTINAEAYEKAVEGVKETTASDLALDDLLKKSFIGLFLTIIIAVILRKKPN
jgi:hypothetical protein